MTPRKELFIKIKESLETLTVLEYVDLQRKQMTNPKDNYPTYFTCALIEIKSIEWEMMVEQKQEGKTTVIVTFYSKDGWMDQHSKTADPDHGLIEIDVIDQIVTNLQGLQGDQFKPLNLINEEPVDESEEMMSYQLTFETKIYRLINPKYTYKKLKLN